MTKVEIMDHIDVLINNAIVNRDALIETTLVSHPSFLMNGQLTDLENSITYVDRLLLLKKTIQTKFGG